MAYILTAQLINEATGNKAFVRYRAYLDAVRSQMLPGALTLAASA